MSSSVSQKRKLKAASAKFKEHILEALQEWQQNLKPLPAPAPVSVGPGWPYVDTGLVGARVQAELGSLNDSIREIERRLKQFLYPYELGPKRQKTFYQYVKSQWVLESLITLPLLWHITFFWSLERMDEHQSKILKLRNSEYGLPLAIHKELAHLLSAHLREIEKLVQKHEVRRNKKTAVWFKGFDSYRSTVLKQLLNEAAIYYPRVRYFEIDMKPKAAMDDWRPLQRIEAQVALLEAVKSTLLAHGNKSDKLACQLTSLFCTSQKHIKDNELLPTPETIRLNREWLKNRKNKGVRIKPETSE